MCSKSTCSGKSCGVSRLYTVIRLNGPALYQTSRWDVASCGGPYFAVISTARAAAARPAATMRSTATLRGPPTPGSGLLLHLGGPPLGGRLLRRRPCGRLERRGQRHAVAANVVVSRFVFICVLLGGRVGGGRRRRAAGKNRLRPMPSAIRPCCKRRVRRRQNVVLVAYRGRPAADHNTSMPAGLPPSPNSIAAWSPLTSGLRPPNSPTFVRKLPSRLICHVPTAPRAGQDVVEPPVAADPHVRRRRGLRRRRRRVGELGGGARGRVQQRGCAVAADPVARDRARPASFAEYANRPLFSIQQESTWALGRFSRDRSGEVVGGDAELTGGRADLGARRRAS